MTLYEPAETLTTPLSLWKHDARFMSKITMADIIRRIAEKHGLKVSDLKSDTHRRSVAWPRQEAMYEAYVTGRWSLGQIGSALGGRDHTTILHGVRRHAEREGLPVPEWGFRARYWRGASERGA